MNLKLPASISTVTKLSKFIALILFISLPFIGFVIGSKYNQVLSNQKIQCSILEEKSFVSESSPELIPDRTENNKGGIIMGTIVINFNLVEYPDVEDEVTVLIYGKNGLASNPFSTNTCKNEADNCSWLLSENGRMRTYGYRLTRDGDAQRINPGCNNIMEVDLEDAQSGNTLGFGRTGQSIVVVPANGIAEKDFALSVGPFE